MINGWYKGILLGIIWLLPGASAAQQAVSQIIIVKSSDNAYFNQTIETLINHVDKAVKFKVIMAADLPVDFQNSNTNKLFVALGKSAVEVVNRLNSGISSYNAYITQEQYQSLAIENQVTILLEQPLHRYLAFCKLMLAIDTIGIIASQQIDLDQRQTKLLENLEIELNQYRVDTDNKLLPVLRKLLQRNDVLLMLPRQSIYNRDTLKGVLLTSYRNRKPVISYSPAHVKAGALASIYSSPVDIGRHLAILVNQKLQDPFRQDPAIQFARFYSITSNRRVARALGINLPGESEIRTRLDAFKQ